MVLEVRTLVASVSRDDVTMIGMTFMHAMVLVDGLAHHARVLLTEDTYEGHVLAEKMVIRKLNEMMPAGTEVL